MDVDNDLEQLMAHLGEFGPYQMRQFALHIMAAFTAGMHMLSLVTVAAVPDHRCAIPGVDVNRSVAPWNTSELTFHIPREKGRLDSCRIIDHSTNQSIKCDSWVFDNTYYESSKAIEWNFVCDRRWMGAVAQSAYMFGVFTGAVVLGSLADKFGRKTIFYLSAVMQLLLGVGVAFIPEYYTFLVIRFLYGVFGSAGSYITGFVMTMEIVGPSKRTICGVTFQAMFAVGVMMVAFWGYFIKDSTLLQVVYGLHSTILIAHWWFANSLAYYGLSLNTGNLAGNPYLILFILGLVEIPSYIMTILLMDRTGRRSLISSLMLLGGICCIIACYIPQETATGSVSAVTVVMLGKFFIAGSFAIIYNYTAELFPTVVRNTALGVGSMCARLSGALTPLITLLDSFDKKLPSVIFATIAIASGLLSLLLPETLNKPMPQTLEDGEKFGEGDTACASCFGRSKEKYEVPLASME
ncbi:organic cation transporter protein isoform X2 [Schistocerca piceifrons]|uniref:organic cation transporter protein isoform X2 n=1 Tax=Schistocerca piceifrons TaxID=274613 RepID=UPI001F5E860E|nr:organic cation transporter protein isoform X2 [Schistocerca piceifrons]